jgi:hypothetical protein
MAQATVEGKVSRKDLEEDGILPPAAIKQELRQVTVPQSLRRGDVQYVISSDSEVENEEPQQEDAPFVDASDDMSVVGRLGDLAVKEELASEVEGEEEDSDTSSPNAAEEDILLAEGGDPATVRNAAVEPVVMTPAQLKAANPEGGQQSWGDRLFPYDRRDPEQTICVVQAWMDLDYLCPAGGCDHIPAGCRSKDKEVVSPGRWDIFLEHWDTIHMAEPLRFRCVEEGCKSISKSAKRFVEHTKNHLGSARAAKRVCDKITKAFNKKVGESVWWKVLKPRVVWNEQHLTAKALKEREEAETAAKSLRAQEAVAAAQTVPMPFY